MPIINGKYVAPKVGGLEPINPFVQASKNYARSSMGAIIPGVQQSDDYITEYMDYIQDPTSTTLSADWDELRALGQSNAERWGNAGMKFLGNAGIGLVDGTIGTLVGIGNTFGGKSGVVNNLHEFVDNPVSKALGELRDSMEKSFQNFETREYKNTSALGSMFTAQGFADNILASAGHVVGAIVPGALVSKGLNLVGKLGTKYFAKQIGKNWEDFATIAAKDGLEAAAKQLPDIAFRNKAWVTSKAFIGSAVGGMSEARMEAMDSSKAVVENLKRTGEWDKLNEEQQQEIIADTEASVFSANLALLTTSYFVQFGKLFGGKYATNKAKYNITYDSLKEFVGSTSKAYIPRAIVKGFLPEGAEELGQYFVSESAKHYNTHRVLDPDSQDFFKSLLHGATESNSKEGWQNFFAGAILGGIMPNFSGDSSTKTTKVGKALSSANFFGNLKDAVKEGKQTIVDSQDAATDLNKKAKDAKSFKIGSQIEELKALLNDKAKPTTEKTQKIKLLKDSVLASLSLTMDANKAAQNGDKKSYLDYDQKAFGVFASALIEYGVIDDFIDDLQSVQNIDINELKSLMTEKIVEEDANGDKKVVKEVNPEYAKDSELILKEHKEQAQQKLEDIKKIREIFTKVDGATNNKLDLKAKSELVNQVYFSSKLDERADKLKNKIIESLSFKNNTRVRKGGISEEDSQLLKKAFGKEVAETFNWEETQLNTMQLIEDLTSRDANVRNKAKEKLRGVVSSKTFEDILDEVDGVSTKELAQDIQDLSEITKDRKELAGIIKAAYNNPKLFNEAVEKVISSFEKSKLVKDNNMATMFPFFERYKEGKKVIEALKEYFENWADEQSQLTGQSQIITTEEDQQRAENNWVTIADRTLYTSWQTFIKSIFQQDKVDFSTPNQAASWANFIYNPNYKKSEFKYITQTPSTIRPELRDKLKFYIPSTGESLTVAEIEAKENAQELLVEANENILVVVYDAKNKTYLEINGANVAISISDPTIEYKRGTAATEKNRFNYEKVEVYAREQLGENATEEEVYQFVQKVLEADLVQYKKWRKAAQENALLLKVGNINPGARVKGAELMSPKGSVIETASFKPETTEVRVPTTLGTIATADGKVHDVNVGSAYIIVENNPELLFESTLTREDAEKSFDLIMHSVDNATSEQVQNYFKTFLNVFFKKDSKYNFFMFKSKDGKLQSLQIGNTKISATQILQNKEVIINFLMSKKYNVDNNSLDKKSYEELYVQGGVIKSKINGSYKSWMFSGNKFKVWAHKLPEDNNGKIIPEQMPKASGRVNKSINFITDRKLDGKEVVVKEQSKPKVESQTKTEEKTIPVVSVTVTEQIIETLELEPEVKNEIISELTGEQLGFNADASLVSKNDVGNSVGGDVETKRIETEAKIKRKDLFRSGGSFANQLGESGVNSVPTNYSERNGIEFVQFSNPNTGIVDVIMTGKSGNDFVGYYRIYENGKATNKWSSKFENQSRNKEDFKTMIGGVQSMLPQGHEYTEKTSISTDGLRIWNQQLSRGYELQYNSKGNLITNRVAINGESINNELGIAVNKGSFKNVSVTNNTDMKKVKEALLPYLQKFGLNESNIHFENGTVEIDLPVLKNNKSAKQSLKEQPKAGTKDSKLDIDNILDEFDDVPFKVENTRSTNISENEKNWFSQAFYNGVITPVFGLIDNLAVGKVITGAKILISNLANAGTIYHEGFHLITNNLPKESKAAYNDLRKRLGDKVVRVQSGKTFVNKKGKDLTDREADEFLAYEFEEFMLNEDYEFASQVQKTLFDKIVDFFKNLLNSLGFNYEIHNPKAIEELFNYAKNAKDITLSEKVIENSSIYKIKGIAQETTTKVLSNFNKIFFRILANPDGQVPGDVDYKIVPSASDLLNYKDANIYNKLISFYKDAEEGTPAKKLYNVLQVNGADYFVKHIEEHKKYLKGFGIKQLDGITENEDLESSSALVKNNDVGPGGKASETNPVSNIPDAIRLLLASLPPGGKPGTNQRNKIDNLTNYNNILGILLNRLSNTEGFQEKLEIIEQLAEEFVEFQYLPQVFKEETKEAAMLSLQFDQFFGKTKNNVLKTLISAEEITVINAVEEAAANKNFNDWKFAANKAEYVEENNDGEFFINVDKFKDKDLKEFKSIFEFLNGLGIIISESTQDKISKDVRNKEVLYTSAANIQKDLIDLAKKNKVVKAEILFDPKGLKSSNRLKNVSDLVAKYEEENQNLNYRSSTGKTNYLVSLPTYISRLFNKIKKQKKISFLELYNDATGTGNPYMNYSWYRKNLADLSVNQIKGLETSQDGNDIDKMESVDYILNSINTAISSKGQFMSTFNRPADRAVDYLISGPTQDLGFTRQGFIQVMSEYTKGELLNDLLAYKAKWGKGFSFLNKYQKTHWEQGNFKFYNFSYLDGIVKTESINKSIKKDRDLAFIDLTEEIFELHKTQIEEAIGKHYDMLINKFKEEVLKSNKYITEKNGGYEISFISKNILENNLGIKGVETIILEEEIEKSSIIYSEEQLNRILSYYLTEDIANRIEQTIFITGNPSQYKNRAAFNKRTTLGAATKYYSSNEEADAPLDKYFPRMDGRVRTTSNEIRKTVANDIVKTSNTLPATNKLKNYAEKMNVSDAASWVTPDHYREEILRSNNWHWTEDVDKSWTHTAMKNALFLIGKKNSAGVVVFTEEKFKQLFKDHLPSNYEITNWKTAKTYYKGEEININELLPLNGNKPQAFYQVRWAQGATGGKTKLGGNLITNSYKTANQIISVEVLGENSPIIAWYLDAIADGIDILTFESTAKNTQYPKQEIFSFKVINGVTEYTYNPYNYNITPAMNWDEYGIQQEIENKTKKTVVQSTQLRSQVLINIKDLIKTNPELESLSQEFQQLNTKRIKLLADKLIKELSLDNIENTEELAERLKKAFSSKNASQNDIEGVTLALSGNNKYKDFDSSINRDKIKNILYSFFRSDVIAKKVKGDAYIQVSVAATGLDLKTYTQDENGTIAAEVAIQCPIDWQIHILKHFKSLDEFNKLLATNPSKAYEYIDKSLLTFPANRIPCQGPNLIDIFKIKILLPHHTGNMVILPEEHTTKTGSDFDVDKLLSYFNNFIISDKKLISKIPKSFSSKDLTEYWIGISKIKKADKNSNNKFELALAELEDNNVNFIDIVDLSPETFVNNISKNQFISEVLQYYNISNELFYDYLTNVNNGNLDTFIEKWENKTLEEFLNEENNTELIENRINDIIKEIVLHPAYFDQLMATTDGAATIVKDAILGKKNAEVKMPEYWELTTPFHNWELTEKFFKQGANIGIVANMTKGYILRQLSPVRVTTPGLMDLMNNGSSIILGSNTETKTGERISDIYSGLMTGFIDVGSDPFVLEAMLSNGMLNAFNLMLQLGNNSNKTESSEVILKLATLPALVEYTKLLTFKQSMFAEVNGYSNDTNEELFMEVASKYGFDKEKPSFILAEAVESLRSEGEEFEEVLDNLKNNLSFTINKKLVDKALVGDRIATAQLLDAILYYKYYGDKLSDLDRVTRPDSSFPKNDVGIKVVQELKKLIEVEDIFSRDDVNNLINSTYITEFDNTRQTALNSYSPLFLTSIEQVDKISREIIRQKLGTTSTSEIEDHLNWLYSNFSNYVIQRIMKSWEIYPQLYIGENSLSSRIQAEKKKPENNNIEIFKTLFTKIKEYQKKHNRRLEINTVGALNKKMDGLTQDKNVSSIIELIESENPELVKIGNDLINYVITSVGTRYTPSSFQQIIPAEKYWQIVNPLVQQFRESYENENNFNTFWDDFMETLILNNPNKKGLVKQGQMKTIKGKLKPVFSKNYKGKAETAKLITRGLAKFGNVQFKVFGKMEATSELIGMMIPITRNGKLIGSEPALWKRVDGITEENNYGTQYLYVRVNTKGVPDIQFEVTKKGKQSYISSNNQGVNLGDIVNTKVDKIVDTKTNNQSISSNTNLISEKIYFQLPTKTESGNVIIKPDNVDILEYLEQIKSENNNLNLSKNQSDSIDYVFKKNSELKEIFKNNKELYQQYLNTIFPNSKVKDIVYHSRFNVSNIKNKDRWRNGFYSGTKDQADLMADMAETGSDDIMTTSALLIDIQNPKITNFKDRNVKKHENKKTFLNKVGDVIKTSIKTRYKEVVLSSTISSIDVTEKGYNIILKTKGYKGVTTRNVIIENGEVVKTTYNSPLNRNEIIETNEYSYNFDFNIVDSFIIETTKEEALQLINGKNGYNTDNFKKEYVVFKPEQIYILGSKEDTEKAKQFVDNNQFQKQDVILAYRGNPEFEKAPFYVIGNPVNWQDLEKQVGRKEAGIEATKQFIDGILNPENSSNPQEFQRIQDLVKSGELKGKKIVYYEEKGYSIHANALDYLINQYNWGDQSISSDEINTFTKNNKTINTEFELTNGQNNALNRLIDFVNSNEKSITLQGAAGTGKTSVIGYLQKYLKNSVDFVYMAPTHAATAELAFATVKTGNKTLPMTVASGFRQSKDPYTGQSVAVMTKKLSDRIGYGINVIVVDEISMLANSDLKLLIDSIKNRPNIKVIYMGDKLQIPEVDVTNPQKKQISKAFIDTEQIYLTEVKRTNSNSILNLLTNLRNNTNSLIPFVGDSKELNYLSDYEFDNLINQIFKQDPENSVLISYTNSGVKDSNLKIRKTLGRIGDIQKNDIIIGYLGYSSKQIEKQNIANSIRYTVQEVIKEGSVYKITAFSQKLNSLNEMGIKSAKGIAITNYYQLSDNDSFKFESLIEKDFDKNNIEISTIMKKLYEAKQAALKNPKKWIDFYGIQANISIFFQSVDLGNNYVYNPQNNKMEIYNSAIHKKIDKELVIEKGVDFGHAITIHKSQGSTTKKVFYDTNTLPRGNSSDLYEGNIKISTEKHSLNYVGLSRASEFLGIRYSDSNLFYKVKQPQNVDQKNQITQEQLDKINENLLKAGFTGNYTIEKFNNLTEKQQNKIKECYGK